MASLFPKTHASTNIENRTKKKVGAEGLAYTQQLNANQASQMSSSPSGPAITIKK